MKPVFSGPLSLAVILSSGCLAQETQPKLATAAQTEPLPGKHASIVDFGAVGDGATLNTQSIQKAIDQLAANGGGTADVPLKISKARSAHLERSRGIRGRGRSAISRSGTWIYNSRTRN